MTTPHNPQLPPELARALNDFEAVMLASARPKPEDVVKKEEEK